MLVQHKAGYRNGNMRCSSWCGINHAIYHKSPMIWQSTTKHRCTFNHGRRHLSLLFHLKARRVLHSVPLCAWKVSHQHCGWNECACVRVIALLFLLTYPRVQSDRHWLQSVSCSNRCMMHICSTMHKLRCGSIREPHCFFQDCDVAASYLRCWYCRL